MLWTLVFLAAFTALALGVGWKLPATAAWWLFLIVFGILIGGHNAERARRAASGFQRDAGWLRAWLKDLWLTLRGGP